MALGGVFEGDLEQLGVLGAFGTVNDALPVGGENRGGVVCIVVREVGDLLRIEVEHVDVGAAIGHSVERNRLPVRRVRWLHWLIDRDGDLSGDPALERVEQEKKAPALVAREHGDAVAVRRKRQVTPTIGTNGQHLRDQVLVTSGLAGCQVAE